MSSDQPSSRLVLDPKLQSKEELILTIPKLQSSLSPQGDTDSLLLSATPDGSDGGDDIANLPESRLRALYIRAKEKLESQTEKIETRHKFTLFEVIMLVWIFFLGTQITLTYNLKQMTSNRLVREERDHHQMVHMDQEVDLRQFTETIESLVEERLARLGHGYKRNSITSADMEDLTSSISSSPKLITINYNEKLRDAELVASGLNEDFEARNKRRVKLLRDTCEEMRHTKDAYLAQDLSLYNSADRSLTSSSTYNQFYDYFKLANKYFDEYRFYTSWKYDDNMKWAGCMPPKHGSSNWLNLLTAAVRNEDLDSMKWDDVSTYNRIKGLNQQKFQYKRYEMLDNLITSKPKFMIARHPFKRLFSAWKDKFRSNDPHYITNRFDSYVSIMPQNYAHLKPDNMGVSFPDFIRYVLDTEDEFDRNSHWKSQTYLCFPCNVDYEYIGKTETSVEDSKAIMEILYPNFSQELKPKYEKQPDNLNRDDDLNNENNTDNEGEKENTNNNPGGPTESPAETETPWVDHGLDPTEYQVKLTEYYKLQQEKLEAEETDFDKEVRAMKEEHEGLFIKNRLAPNWLPATYREELKKMYYWELKMFGYDDEDW